MSDIQVNHEGVTGKDITQTTDTTLTQEGDKCRHESEDRPGRDERGVIATPAVTCVE